MWSYSSRQLMRRFVRQIQPLRHLYGIESNAIQYHRSSSVCVQKLNHSNTAIRSVHSRKMGIKDITGLYDTNESTGITPDMEEANALMNEERKKLVEKLHELANKEDIDGILAMIWASYVPLARIYPLIDVLVTPLGNRFGAILDQKWPEISPDKVYDDTTTRLLEQEAMRCLVLSRQARVAEQIYATRHVFLKALETAPVEIKSQISKKHHRSFYSWLIGAFSQLQEFDRVLEVYEEAIEVGIHPTATMNGQKIRALIAEGSLSQVLPFYKDLVEKDAPMQECVYRNLLMYAKLTQDRSFAEEILPEFQFKGFHLKEQDYFNAMSTVDDLYFYRYEKKEQEEKEKEKESKSKKKNHRASKLKRKKDNDYKADRVVQIRPMNDFRTCLLEKEPYLNQVDNTKQTKEKEEEEEAAALYVLQLWDEMVEQEQLTPKNPLIYERVMTATIKAEEYQRVEELVPLYQKHVKQQYQTNSLTFHRMAVNAYLFLEEPTKAWNFVVNTKVYHLHRSMMFDILDFVCAHDDLELIQRILNDLKSFPKEEFTRKKSKNTKNPKNNSNQIFLSNPIIKSILHTMIRNVDVMKDEHVWSFLKKHEDLFRLRTNSFWMDLALDYCALRHRFDLAKNILSVRQVDKIPTMDLRKGLFLMKKSIQAKEYELILDQILPALATYQALKNQKEKATSLLTLHLTVLDTLTRPKEELWKALLEFEQVFGTKEVSKEAQEILKKYR